MSEAQMMACSGARCPSRGNCKRYLAGVAKTNGGYAAFYSRREEGASACDSYLPVVKISTFEAQEVEA